MKLKVHQRMSFKGFKKEDVYVLILFEGFGPNLSNFCLLSLPFYEWFGQNNTHVSLNIISVFLHLLLKSLFSLIQYAISTYTGD